MGLFSKEERKKPHNSPDTGKEPKTVTPKPAPESPVRFNKKRLSKEDEVVNGSVIAEGALFVGEIETDKPIAVQGKLKGTVKSKSDLMVAETGLVEADVEVENVTVSGRLRGKTIARSLFEVKSTGTIEGEVLAKTVKIDEGGVIIGKIDMQHGVPRPSEKEGDLVQKKERLVGKPPVQDVVKK